MRFALLTLITTLVTLFCVVDVSAQATFGSREASQLMVDRQRRKTERLILLNQLQVKPLKNPKGLRLGWTNETDDAAILPIARSTVGYMPWMNYMHAKKGDVGRVHHGDDYWTPTVFQVIDKDTVIVEYDKFYWIDGVETDGMADGEATMIGDVLEHVGTKTYPTAIGAKSVIQLSAKTDAVKKAVKIRDGLLKEPPKPGDVVYCNWKTKKGQPITGVPISFEKGKIQLRGSGGSEITVAVKDLDRDSKKQAMIIRKQLNK